MSGVSTVKSLFSKLRSLERSYCVPFGVKDGELCSGICKRVTPCWEVGGTEMSWPQRDTVSLERLKWAVPDGVWLWLTQMFNRGPLLQLLGGGTPQGPTLVLILLLGFVSGDSMMVMHVRCYP